MTHKTKLKLMRSGLLSLSWYRTKGGKWKHSLLGARSFSLREAYELTGLPRLEGIIRPKNLKVKLYSSLTSEEASRKRYNWDTKNRKRAKVRRPRGKLASDLNNMLTKRGPSFSKEQGKLLLSGYETFMKNLKDSAKTNDIP